MVLVGLTLSTDAVTPSQKATRLVGNNLLLLKLHCLPLITVCFNITSKGSLPQSYKALSSSQDTSHHLFFLNKSDTPVLLVTGDFTWLPRLFKCDGEWYSNKICQVPEHAFFEGVPCMCEYSSFSGGLKPDLLQRQRLGFSVSALRFENLGDTRRVKWVYQWKLPILGRKIFPNRQWKRLQKKRVILTE